MKENMEGFIRILGVHAYICQTLPKSRKLGMLKSSIYPINSNI